MRISTLVILALSVMSVSAQAQIKISSTIPELAPQVCNVEFVKIDKGENPWTRLKFSKEFDANVLKAEKAGGGAFDDLEVMPELRTWLNESVTGFAQPTKTGAQVQKEALGSVKNIFSFTTVKAGNGQAVAKYSNSWVNADLGIVRLEVCRVK